jgi:cell division septum initiation protein DivIVA
MTNLIEVNEDEYLALIQKNKELQQRIVKLENFLYATLRSADELINKEVL